MAVLTYNVFVDIYCVAEFRIAVWASGEAARRRHLAEESISKLVVRGR